MRNSLKVSIKWTADVTGAIILGIVASFIAGGFRWAAASNQQDAIYYGQQAEIDDHLGLGVYKNLDQNYAAQALIDAHYQTIAMWIFGLVAFAFVITAGFVALQVERTTSSVDVP